ncbi:amidohydrolase, partial [Klebsiella pneumoniae]|nr:amidohydrolase [Klebsiella pneumoniae]
MKQLGACIDEQVGEAARLAGPDIRIRDGKIAAIGSLTPLPEERQIDARDCV